jgi:hypothetical protein
VTDIVDLLELIEAVKCARCGRIPVDPDSGDLCTTCVAEDEMRSLIEVEGVSA